MRSTWLLPLSLCVDLQVGMSYSRVLGVTIIRVVVYNGILLLFTFADR